MRKLRQERHLLLFLIYIFYSNCDKQHLQVCKISPDGTQMVSLRYSLYYSLIYVFPITFPDFNTKLVFQLSQSIISRETSIQ